MFKTRMTPLGASTFTVRVDSYADGSVTGAFTGPMIEHPIEFNSLTSMVVLIDHLLDEQEEEELELVHPNAKPFGTSFELDILFRQNQSWQGRIRFVDCEREAIFHSVLELLLILEMHYGN